MIEFTQEELCDIVRWAEKEMRTATYLPCVERAEGIKAKVSQAIAQRHVTAAEKTVQPS